jgi:hypothetical protein
MLSPDGFMEASWKTHRTQGQRGEASRCNQNVSRVAGFNLTVCKLQIHEMCEWVLFIPRFPPHQNLPTPVEDKKKGKSGRTEPERFDLALTTQ